MPESGQAAPTRAMLAANGWRAILAPVDGWSHPRPYAVPVALWALGEDGRVRGLVAGADGRLSAAESDERFLGYCPPSGAIPGHYANEARRRVEARVKAIESERMVR